MASSAVRCLIPARWLDHHELVPRVHAGDSSLDAPCCPLRAAQLQWVSIACPPIRPLLPQLSEVSLPNGYNTRHDCWTWFSCANCAGACVPLLLRNVSSSVLGSVLSCLWIFERHVTSLQQAAAGNPILHMACSLPRIDTGAYMAPRIPAGSAMSYGRHKLQPDAASAGSGPSLRSQSQTATTSNEEIGGSSGGFFNEAEAGACPCITDYQCLKPALAPACPHFSISHLAPDFP